jgi:hypothetical protein
MTEYIKKKRGRKPKNKIPDAISNNSAVHDTKSEDENIILHLPITMSDINQTPNIKSFFIKSSSKNNNKDTSSQEILYNNHNSLDDSNKDSIIKENIKNKDSDKKSDIKNYININRIMIHNINITCKTKCWWCHYDFSTHAIQLPDEYYNNTFYCIGNFCSFNCAKSYNLNINDTLIWKRCSLLNLLYFQTYNKYIDIIPAASWLILSDYGGNLNIDEFRNNFIFNTKEYIVLHPPLVSRQMQIEESYKINKNTNVSINKLNKIYSEIDSELQLKRTKPLSSNQMNLETMMGLTLGKK